MVLARGSGSSELAAGLGVTAQVLSLLAVGSTLSNVLDIFLEIEVSALAASTCWYSPFQSRRAA